MQNIYIYILKSKLLFTLDNFSSNLPFCFVAPKTLIKSKKTESSLISEFLSCRHLRTRKTFTFEISRSPL